MKGVMTQRRMAESIAAGLGTGRGEQYKSWIRVRRQHSSPVSNLYSLHVPLYARALQLLSGLEFAAANVAIWLGAWEVREQHPAWPDPHKHPASGLHPDFDRLLGNVPGLLEIARGCGIDHGVYPGTKIPFVATMDFTLAMGNWTNHRLTHWSCKPRELLESAPNRTRLAERIELETCYARAGNSQHVVIDGTQWTPKLIENLDWLRPLRKEQQSFDEGQLRDYAGWVMDSTDPIRVAKAHAATKTGLDRTASDGHFRAAAWRGLIDIDLTQDIIMSRPLLRDQACIKSRMKRELLEANHG